MWHFGTWFTGRLGGAGQIIDELDGFKGPFQPKLSCDTVAENKNTTATTTTRVQIVRISGEGEEQSYIHLPECSDRHSLLSAGQPKLGTWFCHFALNTTLGFTHKSKFISRKILKWVIFKIQFLISIFLHLLGCCLSSQVPGSNSALNQSLLSSLVALIENHWDRNYWNQLWTEACGKGWQKLWKKGTKKPLHFQSR